MAITFVGSLPPIGANNGGNVTLTFSNLRNAANVNDPLVEGDVIVAAYACSGTADHAMSTSSSGWTEVSPEAYANGTIDTNLAVYYKVMTGTPDTSIVFVGPGGASNATIGVAMAFRGVDSAVLDVAVPNPATGTGTTVPNPPAITPSTAGAWPVVIGAGAASAGVAYGHTDLSSTTNHFRTLNHAETNDIAIGMGLKTNWVSGAFDPAVWTGGNVNAANSWAAFTLALRQQASITGSLAAQEAGSDDFTASGAVVIAGTLVTQETGSDDFTAAGTVAEPPVVGTLAAQESGADNFVGSGAAKVAGAFSAVESGIDVFASGGAVAVQGTLAAVENGSDDFSAAGSILVQGALAAIEVGSDTAAIAGVVPVQGTAAAVESGDDDFTALGALAILGAFASVETGTDTFSAAGSAGSVISGSLAAQEAGSDGFFGSGLILLNGDMIAVEVGIDDFSSDGTVSDPAPGIFGFLAAQETGADVFMSPAGMEAQYPTPASRTTSADPAVRALPAIAVEHVSTMPRLPRTSYASKRTA